MERYWNSSTSLKKKGGRDNISNYYPITLISNVGKSFLEILKDKLYNDLDWAQGEEQADFWKNRSTIDHTFAIKEIIEKTNEYNINMPARLA